MIELLQPTKSRNTATEVIAGRAEKVYACDFYIEGAEKGDPVTSRAGILGYRVGELVNIDHHAPTPEMRRHVSSTNLAISWVEEFGPVADGRIVINHTDCDSVLSSGIMEGTLSPSDLYGKAAIAADHTGEQNDIADILQSLESAKDLSVCQRALFDFETGNPLDPRVSDALEERRRKRKRASEIVSSGAMSLQGGLAYGSFDEKIDGEFFMPLLPDAVVIMLASPRLEKPGAWDIKLRLGRAASGGLSLHGLGVFEFDPGFGGRWNAGSNSRAEGTTTPPAEYADEIRRRLSHSLRLLPTPFVWKREAPRHYSSDLPK